MDLTPQRLRDVEFKTALRGYDEDEVDAFLEEVGAGIARLQEQVKQADDHAVDAEERLAKGTETEDTLRRTLVLAQRTADAAVSEAKEEAARVLGEATAERDRLTGEAERQAAAIRAEAAEEARRVAEATRQPLVEEIRELEEVRNFLRDDVVLLEGHLQRERGRLRASVASIQEVLDDPDGLRLAAAPELSGVDAAHIAAQPAPFPDVSSGVEVTPVTESPAPTAPVPDAEPVAAQPVEAQAPAAQPVEAQAPAAQPVPETGDMDIDIDELLQAADAEAAASAGQAQLATDVHEAISAEPPPPPPPPTPDEVSGDQFLDELRKAVADESEAPEPEGTDAIDSFLEEESAKSQSFFGRRKG